MWKKCKILVVWAALIGLSLACGFSFGEGLSEADKMETAVVETLTAMPQNKQATPQLLATDTTAPVAPTTTPQSPPTSTPHPCNQATFVSETVADGTEFNVNQSFTKTWRLKNTGTCTWNTNYKLIFYTGDRMSGPTSKNLSQQVAPGEQVDISIDLKAPDTAGTYKGTWRIEDDKGQVFVWNIWVEIKAKAVLAPPPVAKADLTISEFSLNPPIPNDDENVHVRVRAKNQGTTDSTGFRMEWYGLSTFTNPSCSWNVSGGLVAGGSVLMECDFIFASWYPVDKTTIAYVDVLNQVDESNESNNSASISPFGVNP